MDEGTTFDILLCKKMKWKISLDGTSWIRENGCWTEMKEAEM